MVSAAQTGPARNPNRRPNDEDGDLPWSLVLWTNRISGASARELLGRIYDTLWPNGDTGVSWSAACIGDVAGYFGEWGLDPYEP